MKMNEIVLKKNRIKVTYDPIFREITCAHGGWHLTLKVLIHCGYDEEIVLKKMNDVLNLFLEKN